MEKKPEAWTEAKKVQHPGCLKTGCFLIVGLILLAIGILGLIAGLAPR
jgi:hypothetical protein